MVLDMEALTILHMVAIATVLRNGCHTSGIKTQLGISVFPMNKIC